MSTESDDTFSERQREQRFIKQRIGEIETEIDGRWKTLENYTDPETAKKCYNYFKTNIKDLNDCSQPDKMDDVHYFIKKQHVSNYRGMGFECFRLLSSYKDLEEHKNKLIRLDH